MYQHSSHVVRCTNSDRLDKVIVYRAPSVRDVTRSDRSMDVAAARFRSANPLGRQPLRRAGKEPQQETMLAQHVLDIGQPGRRVSVGVDTAHVGNRVGVLRRDDDGVILDSRNAPYLE